MKVPDYLQDLSRLYPTEEMCEAEAKVRFRRYANMTLTEVNELQRLLSLHRHFKKKREREEQAEAEAHR